MIVEVIDSIENLVKIKDEWIRLENQNHNIPYIKYEFIEKWIRNVFHRNEELYIITITEKNKVLGIAPLFIEKRKIKFVTIEEVKFIGNGDYKNILIDKNKKSESIIKKIWDEIIRKSEEADRLVLENINGKSELGSYLLKDDRYNKDFIFYSEIPCINLEDIRSKKKELNKPSKLNKFRNKLEKNFKYEFEYYEFIDEKMFSEIKSIHKKEQDYKKNKNKSNHRRSIFFQDGLDKFYNSLIVDNENIKLFLLRAANGEIINYRICFMENDGLYSWNTAYNIKYGEYRPNNILFSHMFDYLIDEKNIDYFDFGAGRYAWKFKWTSDFNTSYKFEKWNNDKFKNRFIKRLLLLRKAL